MKANDACLQDNVQRKDGRLQLGQIRCQVRQCVSRYVGDGLFEMIVLRPEIVARILHNAFKSQLFDVSAAQAANRGYEKHALVRRENLTGRHFACLAQRQRS